MLGHVEQGLGYEVGFFVWRGHVAFSSTTITHDSFALKSHSSQFPTDFSCVRLMMPNFCVHGSGTGQIMILCVKLSSLNIFMALREKDHWHLYHYPTSQRGEIES